MKLKRSTPIGEVSSEELVREILSRIKGEDPHREGLAETPRRVVKAQAEMFGGYGQDPIKILGKTFDAEGFDGMIMVPEFEFASMCEHHMLPFTGKVSVAYLPKGRIVGLSKIPRMVDVFASRLQVQERLTKQVADTLGQALGKHCRGVAVVIRSEHLCSKIRGVKKHCGSMRTHYLTGAFRIDAATREEFFASI